MSRIEIMFDMELKKPACVLLQAAHGCSEARSLVGTLVDPGLWLLAPTEHMQKFSGPYDLIRQNLEQLNDYHNNLKDSSCEVRT
ncbi:hypothetical protein EVB32_054 [Rhizobium phage RHph_TM39]|uniref:Uncharacterized protein n=1 Tax=Rhizobium phage RHph_TM30 TaxID=2509764 RepID=A0A7S5R9C5_9CAUD|nr:hypothetical protein PQC16_gp054 [Rhizobium phage RHph_TM30]QIG71161.1 hypothetical protein EVB93_054 [Rhizobium phage RHph_TM30]QIG77042.1 hypothetical protein EVB32_054 [Rhizobium phage RHph_TM39]QIG77641.1 hypothetical protein EVB64_054 [Rhizobium phage RHph_TM61]